MQKFFRKAKIGFLILTLASVSSLGSQLFLLQTVAWTRMFIHFSSKSSPQDAFVKTFDGHHPCSLCKEIRQASGAKESAKIILQATEKRAYLNDVSMLQHFRQQKLNLFVSTENAFLANSITPPVPPPRT
jgi:hypothetical protein